MSEYYVKYNNVRLMFQDKVGFGRINKPKRCWCKKGIRPLTPCHHIREYRYAYGAVEPFNGEHFFLVLPYANTVCMNLFLKELSKAYPNDMILLGVDGAAWHKSKTLEIPDNINFFVLLPYSPDFNPIELAWSKMKSTLRKLKARDYNSLIDALKMALNSFAESYVLHWFERCGYSL